MSFGLRKGESGKGKEAPIIRLIMASLREIPTDLIVIAMGGSNGVYIFTYLYIYIYIYESLSIALSRSLPYLSIISLSFYL